MILPLIKKDVLLAKMNILVMMAVIIALPLFFAWKVDMLLGGGCFLYMVIFGETVIFQSISMEEAKYPKAAGLLCAVSYPRSSFVIAKYAFFLIIFAYCFISYTLVALVSSQIDALDLSAALSVLLLSSIVYGIYIPFQFKFGIEKTKFFFMILIFTVSFGTPVIYNLFINFRVDLSVFESIPVVVKCLALAVLSVAILCVSVITSKKIYSKKNL